MLFRSLNARFYQAKPAPVVGATKCPESLCLMSVLPPSGRRVPSPLKALPLIHRSYGLMRRSPPALPSFGFSLVRGVCAGCHQPLLPAGSSRRYSANLSSDAWSHATAVPQTACACFFVCVIGLPLGRRGSASRFYPRNNFSAGVFSRAADISLRSSLRVCSPPRLSLPLCIQPQGS